MKIKNIFITLAILGSLFTASSSWAQTSSPFRITYECHVGSSTQKVGGAMTDSCFPPSLPFRDGFICYYEAGFPPTSNGLAGVSITLLLSKRAFGTPTANEQVCLYAMGGGFQGDESGPLPFNYSVGSHGFAYGSDKLLADCANWVTVGKNFSMSSFGQLYPSYDTWDCKLKVERKN